MVGTQLLVEAVGEAALVEAIGEVALTKFLGAPLEVTEESSGVREEFSGVPGEEFLGAPGEEFLGESLEESRKGSLEDCLGESQKEEYLEESPQEDYPEDFLGCLLRTWLPVTLDPQAIPQCEPVLTILHL